MSFVVVTGVGAAGPPTARQFAESVERGFVA